MSDPPGAPPATPKTRRAKIPGAAGRAPAKADPAKLAHDYLRHHRSGKRAYELADAALAKLAVAIGHNGTVQLNASGETAQLIDRYKAAAEDGKTIIWTPCGARRYELKVTSSPPAPKEQD